MTASAAPGASLATRPFILLCLAMFLGYASQWVMTPVIPLYVQDLGGSAFVAGLVLLAFAVPSFTIRPFVGHLADTWSRAGVFAIGLAILSAGSLLCLVPFIAMLFVGNILRGVGWAGMNVGGYTMLATAAPAARRGEASGYYTGVMTSVHIVFPAVGLWLIGWQEAWVVFLLSALFALSGLPVMWVLAGLVRDAKPAAAADAAPPTVGYLDRGVLIATCINLCSTLVSPSIMAFLPLYARELGIANIGWFYVVAGTTSMFVRPLLGKKSDAMGRGPAIAIGLASQLIGFVLIVAATDIAVILVGGFFVSIGMAMISSVSTALALDLSDARSRGRSMATFSMSFQVGVGLGAVIAGAIADLVSLRGMYVGSVIITLGGFAILASAWKSLPKPQRANV